MDAVDRGRPGPMEVRAEIANGPQAAAQARRLLDPFEMHLPEDLLAEARLILSEIVTNSYKHAGNTEGAPIRVDVDATAGRLRIEVLDRSIFDPPRRQRRSSARRNGAFT